MNTSRRNNALNTLRTVALAATLGAAMLLTACGGGSSAPEQEKAKAPEITRLHKLSAGAAGGSTVQVNVQSVGLISQVTLVSPAADGVAQTSVALAFKADGNSLTVQLPAQAGVGHWMLVVTDDAGLSSSATLVNLGQ
jgi:pectin methylesterase-like acyl-CoA thioesterase